MFRPDLETKLKNIFGVDRFVYDAFNLGQEQETIFIDIDNARDYTTLGVINFLVDGRIAICAPADKHRYGWMHKKIEMANSKDSRFFIFGRNESPIRFSHNNNDFIKYDIDFVYKFSSDFNPISAKIIGVDTNLEEE